MKSLTLHLYEQRQKFQEDFNLAIELRAKYILDQNNEQEIKNATGKGKPCTK